MTIYSQNLGGFDRKNESIRIGEQTKLHKIKIVVFLTMHMGAKTRILTRITSL